MIFCYKYTKTTDLISTKICVEEGETENLIKFTFPASIKGIKLLKRTSSVFFFFPPNFSPLSQFLCERRMILNVICERLS